MKVAPKSPLRPFLHRALQFLTHKSLPNSMIWLISNKKLRAVITPCEFDIVKWL